MLHRWGRALSPGSPPRTAGLGTGDREDVQAMLQEQHSSPSCSTSAFTTSLLLPSFML